LRVAAISLFGVIRLGRALSGDVGLSFVGIGEDAANSPA